ncbi:tripartite tricarboxylate transporter TctB family protein [Consotaella salsifontis]|uniref:Putative tricarboxylic transport membrane protein n=1 Tax=Consotaella salsifontis TaxID=1365950 RepID=A0A1T4MQG8_9HYPH|nr:tripartite tricarboxylate transporter TctB family protein [Consotaella salsifontis]SJZ69299.1 putative tricarboxylic transport membrane protein [Consotaella salsifontis]
MTDGSLLRNSRFLAGLFAVVVGAAWGLASFSMRDAALGDPNAPKYFPWLVSGLCVVCGVALIVSEILKPGVAHLVTWEFTSTHRAALIGSAFGVLYALTFEPLGFIASTTIFIGGISFAYNGVKRWKANIITAIGFAIIVFFIFTWLGKPLVAFPEF